MPSSSPWQGDFYIAQARLYQWARATATRDLHELVEIGALTRTGERGYTRYHFNIDDDGRWR